jgi:hypothetical protein
VNSERDAAIQAVIGYLNFSDGTPSAAFQRAFNDLYVLVEGPAESRWNDVRAAISDRLAAWPREEAPFADPKQAAALVPAVYDVFLPAYRLHHRDSLQHLADEELLQPFFLCRVFESSLACLSEGARLPGTDAGGAFVAAVIDRLDDFIGFRPVATLENGRLSSAYPKEYVRPIPVMLKAVGVAWGPHQALVVQALDLLEGVDGDLLADAFFNLEKLHEFAIDPRTYDTGHPVNQRPGYQFGEWDPGAVGTDGRYHRFVVRAPILAVLRDWLAENADDPDRALFEGAAVLAGTILLASGISGGGPDDFDSEQSAGTLVSRISQCRDRFYELLLTTRAGRFAAPLHEEAGQYRQPFGRIRQHLNQKLGVQRAEQLIRDRLAHVYSRLGFAAAAAAQVEAIAALSTRLRCEIDNLLFAAQRQWRSGDCVAAAETAAAAVARLNDAIECGALLDPWNLLGFGGQFPRFAHLGDSVTDPRAETLLDLVGRIFDVYARILAEAAAGGVSDADQRARRDLAAFAEWWDRFGAQNVSGIAAIRGRERAASARFVATLLAEWRASEAAAGNVAFWAKHAGGFSDPAAFVLVVEALLQKGDLVAAQALLMHWLGQSETVPLGDGADSFADLAERWLALALYDAEARGDLALVRRFLDSIEANADHLARAPGPEMFGFSTPVPTEAAAEDRAADADDEPEDPYAAAYENVTYKDTTDDGVEGSTMDGGGFLDAGVERWTQVAEAVESRLAFLRLQTRLWRRAAAADWRAGGEASSAEIWSREARALGAKLAEFIQFVHARKIDPAGSTAESRAEYGAKQAIREELVHRVSAAAVETAAAAAALDSVDPSFVPPAPVPDWERRQIQVMAALRRGDRDLARSLLPELWRILRPLPVVFQPLQSGGDPLKILATRRIRDALRRLALQLPAAGLFDETFRLLETARLMEQNQIGSRNVTEYDLLFTAGYRAVIDALVDCLNRWDETSGDDDRCAEVAGAVVGRFSKLWTAHIRRVQLFEIEQRGDRQGWNDTVDFIKKYGRELFTQKFLNRANIRGVLVQGVDAFLEEMERNVDSDPDAPRTLLADLDRRITRSEAIGHLQFILQCVASHYDVYKDYNTSTTQSDYGESLHILLDQLRVLAEYERTRFALRPAYVVHHALTAKGRPGAAERIKRAFLEETRGLAAGHLEKLADVEVRHAVKLASVRDRIEEQFVRPLEVDRLVALVEPAAAESDADDHPAFTELEERAAEFAARPTGSGIDVPSWLRKLETETERVLARRPDEGDAFARALHQRTPPLSFQEFEARWAELDATA